MKAREPWFAAEGRRLMADVTVAQFAEVLKVPVDKLLLQLDQAGHQGIGTRRLAISDEAKMELLTHLRRSHGTGRGCQRAAQDHAQAQDAERAEARQRPRGALAPSTSKCASSAPT
jgi:hypothetical protein